MTHLFAANVLSHDYTDMPTYWNLWESKMEKEFSEMIKSTLATITKIFQLSSAIPSS